MTCEVGLRSRRRQCENPLFPGLGCTGLSVEREECGSEVRDFVGNITKGDVLNLHSNCV